MEQTKQPGRERIDPALRRSERVVILMRPSETKAIDSVMRLKGINSRSDFIRDIVAEHIGFEP